jgi:O-antigen ligase
MPSVRRNLGAGLLLLPGGLAVYASFRAGGVAAGVPALIAVVLGVILLVRAREAEEGALVRQAIDVALMLVPGALVIYLSFDAGGFFPRAPAFVAILLALLLTVRALLAEHPFEGVGIAVAVAVGALALFALWTLVSGGWSDAPGRALIEFVRALAYLLTMVLFASLCRTDERLRWLLRGLAVAFVGVSAVALFSRLFPDVLSVTASVADNRLSYPLTYWNALGLVAALGTLLSLHLTTSAAEPAAVRVAAAAAVPITTTTLLFTFSRGAILAGSIGLVAFLLIARPRFVLGAALATVPAAVVALRAAYDADLLSSSEPTTSAATAQGHDLAVVVALCVLAAPLLRLLTLPLDRRVARLALPAHLRRPITAGAWAGSVVVTVVVLLAAGVPAKLDDQYERFVERRGIPLKGDFRDRLVDPSNNGRLDHWDVALSAFEDDRLQGDGAGTYKLRWTFERPEQVGNFTVDDGHSLYLEVLGELGIPGAALIALVIAAVLIALALRARGPSRPLYAVAFALALVWAIHAGIDWDWEMPAVTLWFFALGGLALAVPPERGIRAAWLSSWKSLVGVAWLALAIAPLLVAISETRLDRSHGALRARDCPAAIDAALSSISIQGQRPEPYAVVGYCQALEGRPRLGVSAMERAVELDPDNWEVHYGLALVQGAAGMDPRRATRDALRLNPADPVAIDAGVRFDAKNRPRWRRLALSALRARDLIAD